MDTLDRKALAFLLKNGRASWADLGQHLGLSAPSAAERVRKLEQAGVIRGFSPLLNADSLGYPLAAFVSVNLGSHRDRSAFLKAVAKMEEILECHHVAGEDDYLLKVRCRGTQHLDHLLASVLKERLGVAKTRTTIILSTAKETVAVPLTEAGDPSA